MPIINTTLAKGAGEECKKSFSDRQRIVSWAYPDWQQQAPSLSIIHPKPPYYHDSLFNERYPPHDPGSFGGHGERYTETCREDEDVVLDADELNVDLLVGAKSAQDTLKSYEVDVGFYYSELDSSLQVEDQRLCKPVTDDDVAVGKERWAELVQSLTGGHIISRSQSRHDSGGQDLRSPTSSEFFDLTDSENSEHSMDSDPVPSTPKPRPCMNVAVKEPSPAPLDYSPSRSLNASASSFIPTSTTPVKFLSDYVPSSRFSRAVSSPSPTPTYSNFTFPSLDASIQSLPSLPFTLKKDEQGFYTQVPPSPPADQTSTSSRTQRSSTSLLPPFLADPSRRTRKASKTREIVDQLRSASVNCFDRPSSRGGVPIRPISTPHQLPLVGPNESARRLEITYQSQIASLRSAEEDFDDEGDGWLRAEVEDADDDPEAKARRTRDLVQALWRNRADSTQGSDSDVKHGETGWEIFTQPSKKSSIRRKGSRHRSRKTHGGHRGSSVSSPDALPSMALPLSSLSPIQPFFPAYPIYTHADSPYKPMNMPTQTHCFPTHAAYSGTPFGPITFYPPVIQLPTSASMNMQDSITGGTRMRHTRW